VGGMTSMQAREIADEYVTWALAHGFTTTDIACSLGAKQMQYPTIGQITALVALRWQEECAPIMRMAA